MRSGFEQILGPTRVSEASTQDLLGVGGIVVLIQDDASSSGVGSELGEWLAVSELFVEEVEVKPPPRPRSKVEAASGSAASGSGGPAPVPHGAAEIRGGIADDPRRRGWGKKLQDKYESCNVIDLSNRKLGVLLINTHPQAESIDAHCGRCGGRLNRKYRAHKSRPSHHQGRPAGSLLAWLYLDCGGNEDVHKNRYDPLELPHESRINARAIGEADPTLAPIFAKERDPRDCELEYLGEPVPLARRIACLSVAC
jgi:hypothetical protein